MPSATGLVDVSVALRPGTPEWPGDTPYSCGWTWSIAAGESVNVSTITTSPHVGTHADAPLHVRDGAPASEALPLHAFVGRCAVVDLPGVARSVELDELREHAAVGGIDLGRVERLLLRTGRTIAAGAFPEGWPSLTPGCVRALAASGLRLLGVDAPSVDARESKDLAVHHALFDRGAFNIENLDLRAVAAGWYELLAPPLRIVGLDAAPLRALLRPVTPEASEVGCRR
jgi:arylformamidase